MIGGGDIQLLAGYIESNRQLQKGLRRLSRKYKRVLAERDMLIERCNELSDGVYGAYIDAKERELLGLKDVEDVQP